MLQVLDQGLSDQMAKVEYHIFILFISKLEGKNLNAALYAHDTCYIIHLPTIFAIFYLIKYILVCENVVVYVLIFD